MKQQLEQMLKRALEEISGANSNEYLENIRVKYLGKKGELTAVLRTMGSLSAEERPVIGQIANEVREKVGEALDGARALMQRREADRRIAAETIDVTLPGVRTEFGKTHPLTTVINELCDIFSGMGFAILEGPEVEYDYYNFEALNVPKNHPSRDTQDTFFISENIVLRTQTSPMQIRAMESSKPPIRMIAPGRVYRSDTADATHSPVFHQIEGLVVDKGVTMADLKGTLEFFAKALFGDDVSVRFRPHHFPFTEPSAEMDVTCFKCHGKGCPLCKGEGYIELLGCGMVHPRVLAGCGIDPEVYSGFALGGGLERIVMRRFMIDDIRLLFENDIRFLSQF